MTTRPEFLLVQPNVAIDALYNVHPSSGASADYSRGIVVGVVAGMMAATGRSFDEFVPFLKSALPNLSWDDVRERIPEPFRNDLYW